MFPVVVCPEERIKLPLFALVARPETNVNVPDGPLIAGPELMRMYPECPFGAAAVCSVMAPLDVMVDAPVLILTEPPSAVAYVVVPAAMTTFPPVLDVLVPNKTL